MGKYVYTNRSTPDELQRYLNDVNQVGVVLFSNGGYDTDTISGSPVVYGKKNGVTNYAGVTTTFDKIEEKHGDVGFYCLNAREYYADEVWVDQLPNHEDYTGLYDTDDISQWREPLSHGL